MRKQKPAIGPPFSNVAWGFAHPPTINGLNPSPTSRAADIVRMSALLQWLALAGVGLVLIALRLRRVRRLPAAVFVTLAVVLLVVVFSAPTWGCQTKLACIDTGIGRPLPSHSVIGATGICETPALRHRPLGCLTCRHEHGLLSIEFLWFFMPAVLALYLLVPPRARNGLLTVMSLVFYASGAHALVFMFLTSIPLNFGVGLLIARARGRGETSRPVWIMRIAVGTNLAGCSSGSTPFSLFADSIR